MSSHTLEQMSIDSIVPSKDNARHIDQKSESFLELVNSIRAGGVQIPIHVWPHPRRKAKYEIRAGERRWRACQSLKHKTIPAIVHRGISIEVAMLLTITENKFRAKLTPLEEVEEIARCMDHLSSDAKLIAGLIGQTEQWVRLRANIHKNLSQRWRQAFLSRDKFRFFNEWSIGHLTLVARLPEVAQKELLAEIEKYYWQWENVSVQDLERRIGGSLMLLNRASWNLDDDTLLPKAGACSKCKKRSGAEPVLWFGATGDQIKSKDRCLDVQCWNNKIEIFLHRRAKELSGKYSNLVYIATQDITGDVKEKLTKIFGRVLDQYDTQKSTKGSKGAIPAMVVIGDEPGKVIFVREKQFARPAGGRAKRAGKVTPLTERRAGLKAKRWAQVLIELQKKVEAAGVDQVVYKDRITGIMALSALYGNVACWMLEAPSRMGSMGSRDKDLQKQIDNLVKAARGSGIAAGREKALKLLWASVKPTLKILLTYSRPASQTSGYCIISARWVAKMIGVDVDKMFKEVSKQKGFCEPRSWAGLNEDGTPKAAKVKKDKSNMKKKVEAEESKFEKTKKAKKARKKKPA